MNVSEHIKKLEGPIVVFGAGGFIGVNLFHLLLKHRKDVYGITQDRRNNWRFIASNTPNGNILDGDINDLTILKEILNQIRPKTIFNLAAYGAYSKQKEYKKIYDTNFNSTVNLIEILKELGFSAYIHAGSSSEYGINSAAPKEDDNLVPNSHYAVSKVASYFAVKYYGKSEDLPVAHLRLYSAYGPWEEPDRLIPVLIAKARQKKYPPFVDPLISRDFIYVDDICSACVLAATNISGIKGEVFNIGFGIKTTIKELADTVKEQFKIPHTAEFSAMPNRNWDVTDWYSNSEKAKNILNWKAEIKLADGLRLVNEWQKQVDYDNAFWNWNKQI
ncbi:MAG: NAD-dependent epimerase/dehydratase family protein [Bacteroidia bacterium]